MKKFFIFIIIIVLSILMLFFQYNILNYGFKNIVGKYKSSEQNIKKENALCKRFSLIMNDDIAFSYNNTARYSESDPLKGTNFVVIEYLNINNVNMDILLQIEKQANLVNKTYRNSNFDVYKIKLNITAIIERLFINEDVLQCNIDYFDKNIMEETVEHYYRLDFEKNKNYTIFSKNFGFYNVRCYKNINNTKLFVYGDVINIYPSNISELKSEREFFKLNYLKDQSEKNFKIKLLNKKNSLKIEKQMNLLILSMDSLSYAQLRRTMPLTYNYLINNLTNNIMYSKLNSLADGTYQNVLALLTGVMHVSTEKTTADNDFYLSANNGFYDYFPFVWFDYEKHGYLTAYHEDSPWMGTFKYLKKGFRFKPTTFYGDPYWYRKFWSEQNKSRFNYGKVIYEAHFDLLENLIKKISKSNNLPYFYFTFFNEYIHDYLFTPYDFDIEFMKMLIRLEEGGYLDDTLLILWSDHGCRLKSYCIYTELGRKERTLPFLSMRLPKKLWNTKYHINALQNIEKLISPFDIYQTLRHFLHLNINYTNEIDDSQFSVNNKNVNFERGISLFEQIPIERSCEDALISNKYCPCSENSAMTEEELYMKTNLKFKNISEYVLNEINKISDSLRNICIPFKLEKLQFVKNRTPASSKEILYFQSVITVQPGDAWFDIYFKLKNNALSLDANIVRLSEYGKQSHCVDTLSLKYACFCVKQIE